MLNPILLHLNSIWVTESYSKKEYYQFLDTLPSEYDTLFIEKLSYFSWSCVEYFLMKRTYLLDIPDNVNRIAQYVHDHENLEVHPYIIARLSSQIDYDLPFKEYIFNRLKSTVDSIDLSYFSRAIEKSDEVPRDSESIKALVGLFDEEERVDGDSWIRILKKYCIGDTIIEEFIPLFNNKHLYNFLVTEKHCPISLYLYFLKSEIFHENLSDYKEKIKKITNNINLPIFCATITTLSFKDALIPMLFHCYNKERESILGLEVFVKTFFPERYVAWVEKSPQLMLTLDTKNMFALLGDTLNVCFNIPKDIVDCTELLENTKEEELINTFELLYDQRILKGEEIQLIM